MPTEGTAVTGNSHRIPFLETYRSLHAFIHKEIHKKTVSKMLMGRQRSQDSGIPSDFYFLFHVRMYLIFQGVCWVVAYGREKNNEVNFMMREKVKQNKKREKEGERGRAMFLNRRVARLFLCFRKIIPVRIQEMKTGKRNIAP